MGIHIVDEQLIQRIERLARRERRQEVDVIAQAVELYEEKAQPVSFLLSIVDLGSSREGDISARDEEILSGMEKQNDQESTCCLRRGCAPPAGTAAAP